MKKFLLLLVIAIGMGMVAAAAEPRFRVLAVFENGGHHIAYSTRAVEWLNKLATDSGFMIDYVHDMKGIGDSALAKYKLFIQLDYPPYGWPDSAMQALRSRIENGTIGWVGFHHASLLGEFDGYPMWEWFSAFMGGIQWRGYISKFASGLVDVERPRHPVMEGVPESFTIEKEEWYIYDRNPRPDVTVLATVDEGSYDRSTNIKMGDHPVIWTNEHVKARNVYVFMGHAPELFDNAAYTTLFRNAIFWAAG